MNRQEIFEKIKRSAKRFAYNSRYLLALAGLVLLYFLISYDIRVHSVKRSIFKDYGYEVYRDDNLLHLQAAKCAIVDEVDRYIHTIAPNSCLNALPLFEACEEYDIDIIFVLAQGQIESHYGTRGVASKTNSVFNVYSYDGVSADEINKAGKGYKHPDFSVEPYLRLLKSRYLVDKTERDMFNEFIDIHGHRYANTDNYEKQLMNTYVKIDSVTNLSELLQEYRKYKIITYQ